MSPGHISSLFIIFDKTTFNIYAYLVQLWTFQQMYIMCYAPEKFILAEV